MEYINSGTPNDDYTNQLDTEVNIKRNDDGMEVAYMTFSQTIMEERALAKSEGRAEDRIANIKMLIKAGITNYEIIKNSGLYTTKELAAIQNP